LLLCRFGAVGGPRLCSGKHIVVFRNYYNDVSLTFDSHGKLISGGTPGFGATDGQLYVEPVRIEGDSLTLVGKRPVFFWDSNASEFRLTNIGRRSEVHVTLPSGKPIGEVLPQLLKRILLEQSELQ
jgi:hypothetical protein